MSPNNSKIRVGITCGDPNGIGLEALADALSDDRTMAHIVPIVYAPRELAVKAFDNVPWGEVEDEAAAESGQINLVSFEAEEFEHKPGEASQQAGAVAMESLQRAVAQLAKTNVDVLVTAPINKDTIRSAGFNFPGHTEYLASEAGVEDVLMLLCCDGRRIGVAAGHVALKEVSTELTSAKIVTKLKLMHESLVRDFGIPSPRIAVLGLNPHAGDNGNFGTEEIEIIQPAVNKLQSEQVNVDGPWPSDTVFLKAKAGEVDGIITMYHDQGQIALKLMGFDRGVTVQGGIPFPVTTPAHGTAFDISGTGKADVKAMQAAFSIACNMVSNWQAR